MFLKGGLIVSLISALLNNIYGFDRTTLDNRVKETLQQLVLLLALLMHLY